MSARLQATVLAAVLFIAFAVIMFAQPTGYAVLSPGPTVNILGTDGSAPVISVKGHRTYPEKSGQLRMLTVYEMAPGQTVSLASAIGDWLNDDTSVYPEKYLYPPGTTSSSSQQQGVAQMTSAQDLAKAAALHALGIKAPVREGVQIVSVEASSPSSGKIEVGDVLISVGGKKVSTATGAVAAFARYKPGDVIPVVLQRGSKQVTVSLKAVAKGSSGAAAHQPHVGIGLGSTAVIGFKFPFTINIKLPGDIEGPSAGMMFALTIYDLLTPGSLTDGHIIAGTGTIGSTPGQGIEAVGAIGGIDQKIKGAQRDGAQLFLAPASNCDEVVRANYNHKTMRIVKVSTLTDAINAVKAWTANPNAPLPECS